MKPSNVLIANDGSIKMCDFGIAGVTINSECHTRGIGCKAYMAVSDYLEYKIICNLVRMWRCNRNTSIDPDDPMTY